MYYGSFDFTDQCFERSYDDWTEGYTLGYFCKEAKLKLRELLKIIAPQLVEYIPEDGSRIDGEGAITETLDKFFKSFGDDSDDIICRAKGNATEEGAKQEIEKNYCETLEEYGIQKWGKCIVRHAVRE